jgi:uncharacterized membrane protein YdjX (TVP38/TMEM64 family)
MRKFLHLVAVIIISMLIVLLPFIVIGELPGERWLSRTDDNALLFSLTGSALLVLDIALPVPSSLVITAMGARLGFLPATLWGWLGLMLGNMLGYALGHLYPRRFTTHLPLAPTAAVLFLSRPVPVLAELGTMTAGATRVPLLPFLVSCGLGNAIFVAVLSANAALVLPGDWTGPGLVFPMLLPALAWLVSQALRRRRQAREQL